MRLLWRKAKPRAGGVVHGLPLTTELYKEMGAGVWLVVEAAGPEVLKGPRELSAVASCGLCVCAWRKQTWARVLVREGRQGSVGPGEVTRLEGVSRVWGFM